MDTKITVGLLATGLERRLARIELFLPFDQDKKRVLELTKNFACTGRINKSSNFDRIIGKTNRVRSRAIPPPPPPKTNKKKKKKIKKRGEGYKKNYIWEREREKSVWGGGGGGGGGGG